MKRATGTEHSVVTNTSLRPPSKQQLLFFLVGLIGLTLIFDLYIIREIKTVRSMAILPFSWIPAFVAVCCSKYFGNNYRDLALVKPGEVSVMYAYLIPALSALLMTFVLVLIGIGQFQWPHSNLLRVFVMQPTLGVAVSLFLAFGQELGWRGYLHTHLMRARVSHPMIVTGVIWAIWQWPLVLMTDYPLSSIPLLSLFLFTVCLISFSIILGWLREFSKSVIPSALAHAVHITWLQGIVPEFYKPGALDPFFRGENGFALTIIYLLIAMYLYRHHVAASNY